MQGGRCRRNQHADHRDPGEGREPAIKLARSSIKATQPDADARKDLRPLYAGTSDLIAAAQVIATEFATIATANQYWRR